MFWGIALAFFRDRLDSLRRGPLRLLDVTMSPIWQQCCFEGSCLVLTVLVVSCSGRWMFWGSALAAVSFWKGTSWQLQKGPAPIVECFLGTALGAVCFEGTVLTTMLLRARFGISFFLEGIVLTAFVGNALVDGCF